MNYEEERKYTEQECADPVSDCMVSVSCITFNHGRYLRQAFEGFLSQKTDFRYEILVHDDCSTDDTIAIIKEYTENYPEIFRPMYEEQNQYSQGISNISGVFNFPRARGRYIAMCEGDDFWSDPEKLQKQVDYMEAHPEVSLCAHAAGIVSEDGAFRSESEIRPFRGSRRLTPQEVIGKKTNLPTATLMIRNEYAKQLPQWYFDCPVGDIPLQLFMLLKGEAYYFDEVMSMYRMGRAGSWGEMMDAESLERQTKKWETHYASMERLYRAFDADADGAWRDAVADALMRQRFHIDLKEGKAGVIRKKENRKYALELPPMERKLQTLKAISPLLYNILRKLYLFVKR